MGYAGKRQQLSGDRDFAWLQRMVHLFSQRDDTGSEAESYLAAGRDGLEAASDVGRRSNLRSRERVPAILRNPRDDPESLRAQRPDHRRLTFGQISRNEIADH